MKKVSFLLFFAITLFIFSNANAQTQKKDAEKSGKKGVVKPPKEVVDTSKSLPDTTNERLKGDSNDVSIPLPDTVTAPPLPVPPATNTPPPPVPPTTTTPPPVPPARQ